MGKIRIKTLGDEEQEKLQQEKMRKKREAKIAESMQGRRESDVKQTTEANATKEEVTTSDKKAKKEAKTEEVKEVKKEKKEKFKKAKDTRSKRYKSAVVLVDKSKSYPLKDALDVLDQFAKASFDESVELHFNTIEPVSGNMSLPHGTGKKMRVAIVNATVDPKNVDELVKKVEAGVIDFDILIATPDSMAKLAKVARYLGPRGLMPNPKTGTVTTKPEEAAKKFEAGQINFKTEAKAPILHLTVGKVSFGKDKLHENIKTVFTLVAKSNIKDVTLKSTMSPGIKIALENL